MEENKEKKCKKCGSTYRVWYEGYCQNCYAEIYQKQQEEKKQSNINYNIPNNRDEITYSQPQLGMKWFNFYTKVIMIISIIMNLLSAINTFLIDFIILDFENSIVVIDMIINFGFCYYQYSVYRELKNKSPNSIKYLLIYFIITLNFQIINKIMTKSGETPAYFIGCYLGFLIGYGPNFIYFYKRKDIYRN